MSETNEKQTIDRENFDIRQHIQIVVVPEAGAHETHGGDLAPDSLMWLHTVDMDRFSLPNLELRNVPIMGIRFAHHFLNKWAEYTALQQVIMDGELLQDQTLGENIPLLFKVVDAEEKPDA